MLVLTKNYKKFYKNCGAAKKTNQSIYIKFVSKISTEPV